MTAGCLKHVRNIPTCTNKSKRYMITWWEIPNKIKIIIYPWICKIKRMFSHLITLGKACMRLFDCSLTRGPYFSHCTSKIWWMIELAFSSQLSTPHKNPLDLIPKWVHSSACKVDNFHQLNVHHLYYKLPSLLCHQKKKKDKKEHEVSCPPHCSIPRK